MHAIRMRARERAVRPSSSSIRNACGDSIAGGGSGVAVDITACPARAAADSPDADDIDAVSAMELPSATESRSATDSVANGAAQRDDVDVSVDDSGGGGGALTSG